MKRLLLISITGGVLLLGWWGIYWHLHREPRYGGRTLTQWLDRYHDSTVPGTSITDPNGARVAAWQAVGAMGRDAIPFLLRRIQAPDSHFNNWLRSLAQRQPFIHFHFRNPYEEQYMGTLGMDMIGQAGLPAVPTLVQLTKSPDRYIRFHALTCLAHLRPGKQILLPVLLEMLNDPDSLLREDARSTLLQNFPEEAGTTRPYPASPATGISKTNSVITH